MENGDGGTVVTQDNLSDIQSYLVNFNKEISSGTGQSFILTHPDSHAAVSQTGISLPGATDPLYADPSLLEGGGEPADTKMKIEGEPQVTPVTDTDNPAAGFYTLQSGVVQGSPPSQAPGMVAVQDGPESQMLSVQADGTILNSEARSQLGLSSTSGDESQSGIAAHADQGGSEGESNAYQTVTIVPSEVNQSGEVSYVLIVSQPEGEEDEKGDMDMSVYDFKEEQRGGMSDSDEDGTPRKVHRSTPKKVITPMQQQLMCNYCNYTSPKRYLLTRHMKTHSEERPHKCHICDRGFKTVASLQNHINTHTGVRPHKCKECDAAFTTSGELVRHVRYRHTYEKPHKCTECDYASVELSKLKRHMRSHTGERPYQCPHCSYASPDTYKLKRHLRIHTGEKPYECDICHARFTQSNSLKAHKLIHTGNKPIYQCELCPTTCGRKTDLKIHVQKLHTSDKPLQCKKCGKSFPDRYTYKIHLKTHEGEKCFRCEICPYAALSQRHLESHILTHTGEKPYYCDMCEQSFRQKQLLKRHKNLYHTPDYVPPAPKDKCHECTVCSKVFAHKGNLLRHMVNHDPDNPEYQNALAEGDYEDEEEEEEEYDDEEDLDDDDAGALMQAVSNGQLVATSIGAEGVQTDGGNVQIANINGQQVQVQLVSMGDENNPQVFIQLADGSQLQAVVANQDDSTDDLGQIELQEEGEGLSAELQALGDEEEEEDEPEVVEATTPVTPRRGRGRPPKIKQEQVDDDETAVSPRRSRRSSAQSPPASTGRPTRTRVKAEPEEEQSSKRSGDLLSTPSKRPRRESTRRSNVADTGDDVKREEQKRKDIETCFGFDMGDDD